MPEIVFGFDVTRWTRQHGWHKMWRRWNMKKLLIQKIIHVYFTHELSRVSTFFLLSLPVLDIWEATRQASWTTAAPARWARRRRENQQGSNINFIHEKESVVCQKCVVQTLSKWKFDSSYLKSLFIVNIFFLCSALERDRLLISKSNHLTVKSH